MSPFVLYASFFVYLCILQEVWVSRKPAGVEPSSQVALGPRPLMLGNRATHQACKTRNPVSAAPVSRPGGFVPSGPAFPDALFLVQNPASCRVGSGPARVRFGSRNVGFGMFALDLTDAVHFWKESRGRDAGTPSGCLPTGPTQGSGSGRRRSHPAGVCSQTEPTRGVWPP